jgi:hypothetical protein
MMASLHYRRFITCRSNLLATLVIENPTCTVFYTHPISHVASSQTLPFRVWIPDYIYTEQWSFDSFMSELWGYRDADKSLARPGRKQVNVFVRMAWISFGALPCRKTQLDYSFHLDIVEIASAPDKSLFSSRSDQGLGSTPGYPMALLFVSGTRDDSK